MRLPQDTSAHHRRPGALRRARSRSVEVDGKFQKFLRLARIFARGNLESHVYARLQAKRSVCEGPGEALGLCGFRVPANARDFIIYAIITELRPYRIGCFRAG
jgi:hypothetical protein